MNKSPSLTAREIDAIFDRNAEELETEGTHALSPWIRDLARLQVQMYWERLRELAQQVTDTEVRLQLPTQRSPAGRNFGIEGIVDIVREADGRTTMYDIKTHDAQFVRDNRETYEKQLNVYGHIWAELRGERLDATAVICTTLPQSVEDAYRRGDAKALSMALQQWDPIIPIAHDLERVRETVNEFGAVVDKIESHEFTPPSVAALDERLQGTKAKFAVYVCRNCDARYSCRSYQEYSFGGRARSENAVAKYLADLGDDDARDDFAIAALEVEPPLGAED